jgi:subtilisin family serine protease
MAQPRKAGARKGSSKRGGGDKVPRPVDSKGRLSVLVEMRSLPGASPSLALSQAADIDGDGFTLDHEFQPVTLGGDRPEAMSAGAETYVVRGTLDGDDLEQLRKRPEVMEVWVDTPIAPFQDPAEPHPQPAEQGEGMAACPIPPCDCSPGTPRGTIADVAVYLGANDIWTRGFRGTGIVVGVLDGGITAQGRPVKSGETTRRIPRVIGGWPADWGTEAGQWGEHGNMCATDVLGMAPDAQLYDFRIAGTGGSPGTISRALQAFQWAIDRHRIDGTPHVLTNSWGIFQETWDATYARNPNHPFTRKVVEAINEGILVLFAAGNCGDTCPDGRCGPDIGPGRSIWGANGHPMVMTVGAVNKNEEFVGYSSRGPAALDPNKPDFCSITHFTGYFTSDSGTSAATPILAGIVALMKQAKPSATQASIKACLKSTAKDIGAPGFDQHSGSGIVHGRRAFDCLRGFTPRPTVFDPGCPRPTLIPPRCPRLTLVPSCPRPTLVGPDCIRPTLVGPDCPRPTLPGGCPRPTTFDCPRPTLVGCPRPTLGPECVRPTLGPECVRPTLVGCPRPTLACPRPTLACPRPTLGCGPPPGFGWEDPYGYGGWGDPWAEGAYPAYGSEYDPDLGSQEMTPGEEWYGPQGEGGADPYTEGDYWYW